MGRRGPKGKDYVTKSASFRLHENVDRLVDDLRGCTCYQRVCRCGVEDRSTFLTKLLAEKAGKKLEDLLVPNKNVDQGEFRKTA